MGFHAVEAVLVVLCMMTSSHHTLETCSMNVVHIKRTMQVCVVFLPCAVYFNVSFRLNKMDFTLAYVCVYFTD